jgi:L-asparaginase/Glu-tRNA(Gln) amidotransferase subunit D
MCEEGRCNILAAGGTIVYCVDSDKVKNKAYKLEVLTVVSTLKAPKNNYKSKIGS